MTERLWNEQIADNLARIREAIAQAATAAGRDPSSVRLMAVTKTQPAAAVNAAIDCGITLLGENRAQELCERYDDYRLTDGCEIHFIGHLQTNKVKQVIGKVSTIHSVDSLKLATEISKHSQKAGITTNVLIEVNIGGEESKSGVVPEGAEELACAVAALPGVRVRGLMTIPPILEDAARSEGYFERMQRLMVDINGKNIDNITMDTLSMGMSDDFPLAIKHGSNLIRLGTAIFGRRTR